MKALRTLAAIAVLCVAQAAAAFAPVPADLQAALEQARSAGKQGVVLLFELDGCADCERFRAAFARDSKLAAVYRRHFALYAVPLDSEAALTDPQGHAGSLRAYGASLRVMATPTLVFLDREGWPVARKAGAPRDRNEALRLARYVTERAYERLPFSVYK